MAEKKRVLYFDLLNICACICVVFLHCNGSAHVYSDSLGWKRALAVEVLCYWAVPVFFMLTGATLMNYRQKYNTAEFFKKRLLRTVIPFVIWSVIMLFWKQATHQANFFSMPIKQIVNALFNTSIEGIYWFFIPLFSVYLCMPLLSLLTEEKHRNTLWYTVGVAFLLQSLLPVIFKVIDLKYNFALGIPAVGGYLLYVLLGFLLSKQDLKTFQRIILYALGVFGAAFRYFMTYLLSTKDKRLNDLFFSYQMFYAVFLAVAVFVAFKYIPWEKLFKSDRSRKAISKISACSFGIYLVHVEMMFVIKKIFNINPGYWQCRCFAPFLIYALCLILILLLKKIPVLKHIVP